MAATRSGGNGWLVPWIPSVGISYHVGVDGLSLPLVAMTSVLFPACAMLALRETRRAVLSLLLGVAAGAVIPLLGGPPAVGN